MTVPTQTNKAIFTANGVTTEFPFTFGTLPTADLVVTLIDGETETVVSPSDYTVRGAGRDDGGSVVFNDPPASGLTVLIQRMVPYTQPTDYKNQGSFYPRTHERSFDRVTMQVQQLAEETGRSFRLPPQADPGVSLLVPAPRPYSALVWNEDGTKLVNADTDMTGDMLLRQNLADNADPTKGAALVAFPDNAAPGYLKTVSDLLNGEPVNVLRNIPRSRWAGIQNRTDTEDCADAIMDLMDGAFSARVAELRVPIGTFNIHKPIQRLAGTAPFRLIGDDWRRSIISRGSDWSTAGGVTGSVFNITGVDSHSIENLRIIGNATLYPVNANHAIACSNSNHVTYRRLYIEDWKNSGILVFHHPGTPAPETPKEQNNVIEDCYLAGNGFSNNGILFVDQFYSYIRGCTVRDLGNTGTPQSALQFKNNCWQSHIHDCVAINARHGVAFGQESVPGIAAEQCTANNVLVKDCVWGIYMGSSAYSTLNNIVIDMGGVGSHGIEMIDCVDNALTNIKLRKQRVGGSNPYSVKMTNASSGNLIHFSQLDIDDSIPEIAWFGPSSSKNVVVVDQLKTPAPLTYSAQGVLDENTAADSGNSLEIKGMAVQDSLVIEAGAITLRNPKTSLIRVNTEASAPTDDLDTIAGPGLDGQVITLKTTANSRDVTVKHGTGNIRLAGGVDFTLALIQDRLTLQWDAGVNFWCEVSRSSNA